MTKWINHAAVSAPRNGTNSHTVSPDGTGGTVVAGSSFTPTTGRLLVCVVSGAATSTTPSGWTLPSGGSVVGNSGHYVWHRVATGADSLTTTHNGSNWPVMFHFFEFAADATFLGAVANSIANGGAGPTLSGLTGSNLLVATASFNNGGAWVGSQYSWSTGIEVADIAVGASGTEGYYYGGAYVEDYTGASWSSAATLSDAGVSSIERLVWGVNTGTPPAPELGAVRSIWGNGAPPGAYTLHGDGDPYIRTGHAFYTYGAGDVSAGSCIGARIWLPSNLAFNGTTLPPTVRLMGWSNIDVTSPLDAGGLLDSEPLRSKIVTVTQGGWLEATWDTPFDMPGDGLGVMIGVEWPNNPDYYLHTPGPIRASDAPIFALDGTKLVLSDHSVPTEATPDGSNWYSTVYKIGTDITKAVQPIVGYGLDILVAIPGGVPPPSGGYGATIAAENLLSGQSRAYWLDGVGSEAMPAFSRSTYYAPGATAEFSVDYNAPFTFEVFRLGHYSGDGARRVHGPVAGTPIAQATPVIIPNSNGAIDCAHWTRNVSWVVPNDAVPGWYYVLLKGTNGTDLGHALFTVSDAAAKKPVLAISSDSTWHAAYNGYGNNNVYGATTGLGSSSDRALCSSYDKPVITLSNVPQTHFFNSQFASFKFMESVGIEVGYATIEQINADPTIMDGRDVIVFAGHNEYIPQPVMSKTKSLLASGQKIVNWAANDFFWRVRFGTTNDTQTTTNGRIMWCRKDTMPGPGTHVAGVPFVDDADWQGTWQDTRWSLREPSSDFFGDRFIANGLRSDQVKVPATMKTFPLWRDCPGIQALSTGQEFSFGVASLGMEWDKPEGTLPMVKVSSSTVDLTGNSSDENGQNYNLTGTHEHAITLVQSGTGLVFNFNSDQWGATLDGLHLDRIGQIQSTEAKQASLNVLADFGAIANPSMVTSAGLINPAPLGNLLVAYGLASPGGSTAGMYYSNGASWVTVQIISQP